MPCFCITMPGNLLRDASRSLAGLVLVVLAAVPGGCTGEEAPPVEHPRTHVDHAGAARAPSDDASRGDARRSSADADEDEGPEAPPDDPRPQGEANGDEPAGEQPSADGEQPLERVDLDVILTDAEGPFVRWENLNQHPVAVTFFYTRDRDPGRSEWALQQLETLEEALENAGMAEGAHLVGLTVDPRFDQAHRLQDVHQTHRLSWPTSRLLQPRYGDLPAVADAFALDYEQVDVETIDFEPTFVVLAPGGKVLYEARGRSAWDLATALEALRPVQ